MWSLMKPLVFGSIMDFFAEGKPVMLDEPVVTDTTILEDDDEVVAMIKELLQERVRPRGASRSIPGGGGVIGHRPNVQLARPCGSRPDASDSARL